MSNIVFGKDMILFAYVDAAYTPIGCATNCSFEFENELIGKTDINAGLFRKKRVRISDCSAEVQGLTTLENDGSTITVMYFLQEGVRRTEQALKFVFTDEEGNQIQITGNFLVQSVSLTGDVSAFGEMDINFEGTGGFTISATDDSAGDPGIPGDVMWDWWEAVEGEISISGPGHYGRSFAGQDIEDIIEVDREGTQYDLVSGTPGEREVQYDGTELTFKSDNPFNAGTRVFVIWQPDI